LKEVLFPSTTTTAPVQTTTTQTTTTTTTTTTVPCQLGQPGPGQPPVCGGSCPDPTLVCEAMPAGSGCVCVPAPQQCSAASGQCGGLCPSPAQVCQVNPLDNLCECVVPCGTAPQCGGPCPSGQTCMTTPTGCLCTCGGAGAPCTSDTACCTGTCDAATRSCDVSCVKDATDGTCKVQNASCSPPAGGHCQTVSGGCQCR
jgi:hypothetical protein